MYMVWRRTAARHAMRAAMALQQKHERVNFEKIEKKKKNNDIATLLHVAIGECANCFATGRICIVLFYFLFIFLVFYFREIVRVLICCVCFLIQIS